MEHIRAYVLSVCFTIVFCVGATIVIPSKKYEKIIRVALGVFIVASLIKPIANIMKYDWQSELNVLSEESAVKEFGQLGFSQTDYMTFVYSSAEKSAKSQIEYSIKNMNIKFDKIEVKYDKDSIYVEINGVDKNNMQTVSDFIEKNYGVKPKVTE